MSTPNGPGPLCALAAQISFANNLKGFAFTREEVEQKMLLAVSEICEAQEELRDGVEWNEIYYMRGSNLVLENNVPGTKPCGFPVEIADAIIRLLHILHNTGVDIDAVVAEKLAFNATRPMKHGRAF